MDTAGLRSAPSCLFWDEAEDRRPETLSKRGFSGHVLKPESTQSGQVQGHPQHLSDTADG